MGNFLFTPSGFPTWVITLVSTAAVPDGFHQKFVYENLHKKVGNPIDSHLLIRYIYIRNNKNKGVYNGTIFLALCRHKKRSA